MPTAVPQEAKSGTEGSQRVTDCHRSIIRICCSLWCSPAAGGSLSSLSICSELSSIPSAPGSPRPAALSSRESERCCRLESRAGPERPDPASRRAQRRCLDLVDEALVTLEILAHEAWIGLAEVGVVQLVQ